MIPDAQMLEFEVLGPAGETLAAFASPLEAYRYAALIYDPPFVPRLRRGSGAVLEFRPNAATGELRDWLRAA